MENKEQSKGLTTVDLQKSIENLCKTKFASKAVLDFNNILDKQPKDAIKLLSEQFKGTTINDSIYAIQQQSATGRAAWVSTSLMVARAYEGNENGDKRDAFLKAYEEKLGYKRSSIDSYIKAGRKLIEGNFDKIPKTRDEFMKPVKKDKELRVFKNCTIINQTIITINEGSELKEYVRYTFFGSLLVKDNNVPTETEQIIVVTAPTSTYRTLPLEWLYQITESNITTVNKGKESKHLVITLTGKEEDKDITQTLDTIQAMRLKA